MIRVLSFLSLMIFSGMIHAELILGDILEYSNLEELDLTRPVGAYKKLIQWKLPRIDSQRLYQCLIYKVPRTNESGELFINTFYKDGCELGKEIQKRSLLIHKDSEALNLKTQSDYSGLHIQFITQSKILKLTFPQAIEHKRWTSLGFSKNASPLSKKDEKIKDGEYCIKWNKHCEAEVSYSCHNCAQGLWSESLNYKECPSKLVGVCGESSCGGKDQPACLKMVSLKFPLSCEEALEFVNCEPLLIANCEGTGEIICR